MSTFFEGPGLRSNSEHRAAHRGFETGADAPDRETDQSRWNVRRGANRAEKSERLLIEVRMQFSGFATATEAGRHVVGILWAVSAWKLASANWDFFCP